jgi:hypothetical protein
MAQNNNQVVDLDKLFGLEQQSSVPTYPPPPYQPPSWSPPFIHPPTMQPPEYNSINTQSQPYYYQPNYQVPIQNSIQYQYPNQYPAHIPIQNPYYPPQKSQEEINAENLEKIRKLRKELEEEIERENNAKKEMQKVEERMRQGFIPKIFVEEDEKTWMCSKCTFKNKLDKNKCEMCEYPIASPQVSSDKTLSIQEKKENIWICSICTLHNQNNKIKCDACENMNPNPIIEIKSQPRVKSQVKSKQQHSRIQTEQKRDILWQKDEYVNDCNKCKSMFTVIRRKHHCRKCGYIFCDDCSSKKMILRKGFEAERVCNDCYKGSF